MVDTHPTPPSSKTPPPPAAPGTPPTPGPGTARTPQAEGITPAEGIAPFAGAQTRAIPVLVWKVNNATHALPQIMRMPEAAALTVNAGTPVRISATAGSVGYLIESPAIAAPANVIAGFSVEFGHNLTANGTAPVGGSGLYYGSVPNQVNARNVPLGAPMADGNLGIYVAADETIFVAMTDSAHALVNADIGATFGMTKDTTTGNWFLDTTITAAASGAMAQVTELVDPIGTLGGRLAFRVARPYQQLFV